MVGESGQGLRFYLEKTRRQGRDCDRGAKGGKGPLRISQIENKGQGVKIVVLLFLLSGKGPFTSMKRKN